MFRLQEEYSILCFITDYKSYKCLGFTDFGFFVLLTVEIN